MSKANDNQIFSLCLKEFEFIIPVSVVIIFSVVAILFSASGIKLSISGVILALFVGYVVAHVAVTAYSMGRKHAEISACKEVKRGVDSVAKGGGFSVEEMPMDGIKENFDPSVDF